MTAGPTGAEPRLLSPGVATIAVLLAALGFSSISIATVIGTRDGTPLPAIVTGRFLISALLLYPLAGGWQGLRLPRGHMRRLIVQGGVGQAAVNLLSLSALAYMPAATVVFLFYTYPAWVAVSSAVRGTDRVGPRRLFALLLSLGGIVVIVGAPGAGAFSATGVAFALSGALVYGLYFPLLRQLQAGTTPTVATFYIAIGVCLTLGVYLAASGQLTWRPTLSSAGAMIWLAVVPTVLAFRLILRGIAALGPVRSAIVSTAEPFCAAILGAVVLDQPVTATTMAGGALIALAVLILQRPERERLDA